MKILLENLSLPLLFVLSGCGDSDDSTRGIRKGTQVVYCWKGEEDKVLGVEWPLWLSDKTENTVTVRTQDKVYLTYSKSESAWMEKAKDSKPMPKREGEE